MSSVTRTLAGGVNNFYKAHTVVYYELLAVSIFYRRVVCLLGKGDDYVMMTMN